MEKRLMQDLIETAGYETRSYSGRGMYGKSCLAVEVDKQLGSFLADIIHELKNCVQAEEDNEEVPNLPEFEAAEEAFRCMRSDSMGLGTVYYFPDVPYVSDEPEDEEVLKQDGMTV